MDMNLSKFQSTEKPGVLHSMGLQRVGHDLATEQQQGNPRVRGYSLSTNTSILGIPEKYSPPSSSV